MKNKKESVENAQEKGIVNEIYAEIEKKKREYKERMNLIETIFKIQMKNKQWKAKREYGERHRWTKHMMR